MPDFSCVFCKRSMTQDGSGGFLPKACSMCAENHLPELIANSINVSVHGGFAAVEETWKAIEMIFWREVARLFDQLLGDIRAIDQDQEDFKEQSARVCRKLKSGPAPKVLECMAWLRARLTVGPERISKLRDEAGHAGFRAATLYKASRALELLVSEVQGYKWWTLKNI